MEALKKVAAILETRGFKTQVAETKEEAVKFALELIPAECSVGIPGTMSVREAGLYAAFKERGSRVIDHWESKADYATPTENRLAEFNADWIVTSANGLSAEDGAIVNIDGSGNRVAAISWAPGKLLFLIGKNKIADNLSVALQRAREIASVKNAARFDIKTPCKLLGKCMHCNAPDKICNVVTILEHAQLGREVHVILVNEDLGY